MRTVPFDLLVLDRKIEVTGSFRDGYVNFTKGLLAFRRREVMEVTGVVLAVVHNVQEVLRCHGGPALAARHEKRVYKILYRLEGETEVDVAFGLHDGPEVLGLLQVVVWSVGADPARIKAARRKYTRMADKVKRGELSETKLRESYTCLQSHVAKGNSHNLIVRMDEYINKLLEVENGNHNCPKGTSRP